jgi:hypothetical protein
MHSLRHWLPISLLLTLPFWMACPHSSAAVPMNDFITRYDSLLGHDGDTVQIQGIFVKYNAMPQFGPGNAYYLPGILLENDSVPKLYLAQEMSEREMDTLDGKQVTCTGVFSKEERLHPGDPPWASRRTGSWLYDLADLTVLEQ